MSLDNADSLNRKDSALQRISNRTGIDIYHFRPRDAGASAGLFGISALTTTCQHYNFWRDDNAALDPDISDLSKRVLRKYRPSAWKSAIDKARKDFFSGAAVSKFYSPIDDSTIPVIGSIFGHRFDYIILSGPEYIRFLLVLGNSCYGIYYPERNTFIHLIEYEEPRTHVIGALIRCIINQWSELDKWLCAAEAGNLGRAFLIADPRPSHFLRQTLGFIDAESDTIKSFAERGGLCIIVRDWCFINPSKVFPFLEEGPVLRSKSDQTTALGLNLGLSVMRAARIQSYTSVDWVQRLLPAGTEETDTSNSFDVWISVDAEKLRFENQVSCLSLLIARLTEMVQAQGRSLRVFWDGWTAREGQWTIKDQNMVERISNIVNDVLSESGMLPERVDLFGLTFEEKLTKTRKCNLAIATHGTASIPPSVIQGIPTVTYHVASVMSQSSYVDADNWHPVAQDKIKEDDDYTGVPHQARFSITEIGFLTAVNDALSKYNLSIQV